jgi:tRNA (mo5U34)-methyltransferase
MDMNDDLGVQVARYRWYHSIDLGEGVVTPGAKSLAVCTAEANAIFNRIDLTRRTVLDVGAWNGFFSFEAKRRGAAHVLATDSLCWTQFRGRETFDLARSVLGLQVDAREFDVAQLSPDTIGEFDIVLYLGVFYHRYDAIEALARVARLARCALVVETQLDLRHVNRPAMAFYPERELAGDGTCWWGPNEHCMKALLLSHGFSEVEISAHPTDANRAIFHAWRSTDARIKPLPNAERLNRDLCSKIIREVCRPFRRFFN